MSSDRRQAMDADAKRLAEMGYSQDLNRNWSGFSNFAISFSIISILAGCFTTFGAGLEQRRPDLDLVVLADHQRLHPDHRLHHVRAGLGLPDLGRHLLVGGQAGRPPGRLLHRLAQPDRPDRGDRRCRLRLRDVHRPDPQHLVDVASPTSYSLTRVFLIFVVVLAIASLLNIFSGHLMAIMNNISVWWHVAGVAVDRGDPAVRPGPAPELQLRLHRAHQQLRLLRRQHSSLVFFFAVLPLGFLLTQYTITGFDACAHLSRGDRGRLHRRRQGHLAVDLLLRHRRLDPAAVRPVRRAERADGTPTTRSAPAVSRRSSAGARQPTGQARCSSSPRPASSSAP